MKGKAVTPACCCRLSETAAAWAPVTDAACGIRSTLSWEWICYRSLAPPGLCITASHTAAHCASWVRGGARGTLTAGHWLSSHSGQGAGSAPGLAASPAPTSFHTCFSTWLSLKLTSCGSGRRHLHNTEWARATAFWFTNTSAFLSLF